jgi:hypothetical protein
MGLTQVEPRSGFGDKHCVRRDESGQWHMMNRRDRGWGEKSIAYERIGDLLATWGVMLQVDELDPNRIIVHADKHGNWWPAVAVPSDGRF